MSRGGARVNSGPPPDPHALRRDRPSDKDGWTTLPAQGYDGKIPAWPLIDDVALRAKRDIARRAADGVAAEIEDETDSRKRAGLRKKAKDAEEQVTILDRQIEAQRQLEASLWKDLWRTPQAAVWIRLGWRRDVAQYVRHKVMGELGSLDDAKEARQWSDRLGLNPAAMLRNRWRIAADEVAAKRADRAPVVPRTSARDRLKALDGGAS